QNIGTREDRQERGYYPKYGGNGYTYDNLHHDSLYFSQQLEYVKKYFHKVSKGHIHVDYSIYPKGPTQETAYTVPEKMVHYSPGAKKPEETFDEYYYRRTVGLMKFIRDAVRAADENTESPFKNLFIDTTDNKNIFYETYPDGSVHKAAILLIHAGASYLTDGGYDGAFGQDTPSDIIDAFITPEWFGYVASTDTSMHLDTIKSNIGIKVNKNLGNQIIIDEIMMVSETSNQDSLNWGIHGIMVNQVARQIGIPDLYSTMSGISGIGGFCIMDFAGYSAGKGFIPPLPSAWVRAFMGWDIPVAVEPGDSKVTANLKAVSAASEDDTTILLIPINDHEFYLIENRQRNLTTDPSMFNYDTTENKDTIYISPYEHVNLNKNVIKTFDSDRNVIDSVSNQDVGIPASGVLIWHIDEYIIRDHLEENVVNADSSYRGISLEEADGVVDLGVMFQDVFYQAAFDYGGAEDVFPHHRIDSIPDNDYIHMMGPFTRPSTQSNDGGHTYLKISVNPGGKKPVGHLTGQELCRVNEVYVINYVDSVFTITLEKDTSSISNLPNWPRRLFPDKFHEPVLCDVYQNNDTLELAVLDTTGRLYIWPARGEQTFFTGVKEAVPALTYKFDTTYSDSVSYLGIVPYPSSFPTCVNKSLYIPSRDGRIYILRNIDSTIAVWDTVSISDQLYPASSYICNYKGTKWAVGCVNGAVVFGNDPSKITIPVPTYSQAPVQALAVLDTADEIIITMNASGLLQACSEKGVIDSITISTSEITEVFPPFTIATANLDQDNSIDIVICDRKQGLWLYNWDIASNKLKIDNEWVAWPNDWAGSHSIDTVRRAIPDNESAPSIADLDNDNILDIVIGGTNGIYAYNHRGVLLSEFPALLDPYYWYQRQSIASSPAITQGPSGNSPLIVFTAPTGENVTFAVAHIDSSNAGTGTIYFTKKDGTQDSASGFTSSFIDSLFVIGDSIVLPYMFPGGYVDAFNVHGKRPDTISFLSNVGNEIQSNWPFTVGGPITTSPILCDIDKNNKTDVIAISEGGFAYRWELSDRILPNSFIWPQAGSDGSRTFTYSGPVNSIVHKPEPNIDHFYSYPNPLKIFSKKINAVSFKYQLSQAAQSTRLDIFTYTGHYIFSDKNLPSGYGWNEVGVPIHKFGSAVYRCRLEVNFNGTKKVKYWKMAIVR
ncbi:MAG: hypothetical protein PVI26_12335, partial [Chitinispirillia bacterium]